MIHFLAIPNFSLFLNGNLFFLFVFILTFIAFSFVIYKYTIPNISKTKKIFLTFLRCTIFILICFLLFEPIISFTNTIEKSKKTFLYVDNSNSIVIKDSINTSSKIFALAESLIENKKENVKLFSFANNVNEIKNVKSLKFNEQGTNFYSVYNHILKNKNEIENVVIISDGNLNQGDDPIYYFEKLGIKVITIGIGDTTSKKNIGINNISYSQNIYFNKGTNISVIILNKGFDNQNANIKLYEEDKIISQKNEILNSSGFNKVTFNINPSKLGDVKYKIEIDKFNGESSFTDNTNVFYINVLSNKIKIGLVSDAPSNDLTAIVNALRKDENFQLIKFYKINNSKSWSEPKLSSIDSVDVFFFINFPIKSTTQLDIEKFLNQIKKGKPFFISISNQTDLDKLNYFSNNLPISIKSYSNETQKVQPELLQNEYLSNFSQVSSSYDIWNKLAPIDQINFNFTLKTEGKIIVNSQINRIEINKPIITLRNIGNERSILFNGFNFWYWQFQNAGYNYEFFSNFIIEIAKWLNQIKNKNYFSIKTNKKSYSQNEEVEFFAELYDQSFNPIDTSKVTVKIKNSDTEINLVTEGNGTYSGKYIPNITGEIIFEANNSYYKKDNNKLINKFFVSNIPIERSETKSNTSYLKQISSQTNGRYVYINNANNIINEFVNFNTTKSEIFVKKDFQLWNNKFILLIIILFLALEWFTRKKLGMI